MRVRLIGRPGKNHPQWGAIDYAREHGFTLGREPFGKRGSLIEVYKNGEKIGYRKSYAGALNLMQKHINQTAPKGAQ